MGYDVFVSYLKVKLLVELLILLEALIVVFEVLPVVIVDDDDS